MLVLKNHVSTPAANAYELLRFSGNVNTMLSEFHQ
jgi:hypothetical protein